MEQTRNQLDLSLAQRDAARATAERLGVVLKKLQITAPFDGTLLTRLAQPGETVAAGSALLRIARMDKVRIEAEIDEFDLSRLRVASPVRIHAEGMDGFWRGHVEEIPQNVVGRKLKPQDPARPSDTRILLVKVALDEPTPLKLGQRVELEVEP
jgi:HlyD family secretion protein